MNDLGPPSTELVDAYSALDFDDDPAGMKERVWAGVTTAAVVAPALTAAMRRKIAGLALGCLVVGAGVGVMIDRQFVREPVVAPDTPQISPPQVEETAVEVEVVEPEIIEQAPEVPELVPVERSRVRRTPMQGTELDRTLAPTELARERTMIDAVRAAVRAGHPREALETIRRHEREFSSGRLVEEREGLRVVALVRAGRVEQAEQRAARFRARYPRSLLTPMIEAALRAP